MILAIIAGALIQASTDGAFGIDRNGDGVYRDDFVLMADNVYTSGVFNPNVLRSSGQGGTHRLAVSGTTYHDNVLELVNYSTNGVGGSHGYAALVLYAHDDGWPGSFALGLNKDGWNEFRDRVFFATNPPFLLENVVPPRDMIFVQHFGPSAEQHVRLAFFGAARETSFYGWDESNQNAFANKALTITKEGKLKLGSTNCTITAGTVRPSSVEAIGSIYIQEGVGMFEMCASGWRRK